MHEMQTVVTDVRGVCPSARESVCPSVCLSRGSTVCVAFVQPLKFQKCSILLLSSLISYTE